MHSMHTSSCMWCNCNVCIVMQDVLELAQHCTFSLCSLSISLQGSSMPASNSCTVVTSSTTAGAQLAGAGWQACSSFTSEQDVRLPTTLSQCVAIAQTLRLLAYTAAHNQLNHQLAVDMMSMHQGHLSLSTPSAISKTANANFSMQHGIHNQVKICLVEPMASNSGSTSWQRHANTVSCDH